MLTHTVYGGAHLFTRDTPRKLGQIALRAYRKHLADDEAMREVFGDGPFPQRAALEQRLEEHPVDDYRIDFEDGFGLRSEEEEHAAAHNAGDELAALLRGSHSLLRVGLRTRGWSHPERLLRTLRVVTDSLRNADFGSTDFVATLPKVTSLSEVTRFCDALSEREHALGWKEGRIGVELLVEHPHAMAPGALHTWLRAAAARLRGLHLGAYDLLAELGVPHTAAVLAHPYCDAARLAMRLACAASQVDAVDGVTNRVPVELHRAESLSAEQHRANHVAVRGAWKAHISDVLRGISLGFYQGWDVHPAQLVSRHGAQIAYFSEHVPQAQQRLRGFYEQARQARASGSVFDDEASMRGVELFLARAGCARARS